MPEREVSPPGRRYDRRCERKPCLRRRGKRWHEPIEPGDIQVPWDWTGVVGTGQSLAVGDHGSPVASTTQPYNNLKLSTGTTAWPVDPNDSTLTMVPLTEPIGRRAPTYPSSWPQNIAGETMHSSMGNQITALVMQAASRDYVSVQGEFGENGQGYTYLRKGATVNGVNGRAYQATLIETQAITRLAQAAGKTYGVGAITVVHGESDAGNTSYASNLVELWTDYNADIPAITGQTQSIPMLVSQQNSTNDRSASTLAQWKVGVDHPADFVCVGPHYPYESADGTHLVTEGYRQLGEKFGQVYFERVVLGRDWQPLQPTGVERSGRVITVHFHVPVRPLVWDTTLEQPHQNKFPQWASGKGFEVRAGTTNVADQLCGNRVRHGTDHGGERPAGHRRDWSPTRSTAKPTRGRRRSRVPGGGACCATPIPSSEAARRSHNRTIASRSKCQCRDGRPLGGGRSPRARLCQNRRNARKLGMNEPGPQGLASAARRYQNHRGRRAGCDRRRGSGGLPGCRRRNGPPMPVTDRALTYPTITRRGGLFALRQQGSSWEYYYVGAL